MVRAFFLISLFFIFLSCGDSSKNATDSSGSGSNVDGQIKTGNSGSNTANSGNSGGQKCLPKCSGKECGDDGCGKSCGQCSKDKNCKNGQCLPNTSSCQNPKKTAQISEISLKPQSPAGKYQKIKNGKFTDHFIYNSSGTIKVGVREDWGASIIFFGIDQGKNGNENTNVIDSNDPGREVQVAFYDAKRIKQGCSYNSSCLQPGANQCKNSISYLGWNPVQGGNRCNEGSPVKSISFNKGKLEAMVEPLHWNPDWQRNDCQIDGCNHANKKRLKSDILYKQKLSFVGERTVMMEMEIKNLSNINVAKYKQEIPTLYTAYGKHGLGNYQVLLDSNSQAIKIDKAANDGFFTKNFSSPGAWVSLQNSNRDYGVALYYESHQTQYDGWQKKDVFNNVRADIRFAIPAKATVKARAYLFLGSYKTNQLDIKNLSQKIRAFGVMDSPKENQVITSKTLEIKGWVLDNHPIQKVKVYIDGKLSSESSLQKDRNDICQIYPNYPSCPKVGFQIDLDISKLSDCPHLLELKAIEQGGNEHLFAQEIFMKK